MSLQLCLYKVSSSNLKADANNTRNKGWFQHEPTNGIQLFFEMTAATHAPYPKADTFKGNAIAYYARTASNSTWIILRSISSTFLTRRQSIGYYDSLPSRPRQQNPAPTTIGIER